MRPDARALAPLRLPLFLGIVFQLGDHAQDRHLQQLLHILDGAHGGVEHLGQKHQHHPEDQPHHRAGQQDHQLRGNVKGLVRRNGGLHDGDLLHLAGLLDLDLLVFGLELGVERLLQPHLPLQPDHRQPFFRQALVLTVQRLHPPGQIGFAGRGGLLVGLQLPLHLAVHRLDLVGDLLDLRVLFGEGDQQRLAFQVELAQLVAQLPER